MLTNEDAINQVANQQQVSVTAEMHTMNVELHLVTELHSGVKLQNKVEAYSNSEISVHGRDVEIPDIDAHSNTKAET